MCRFELLDIIIELFVPPPSLVCVSYGLFAMQILTMQLLYYFLLMALLQFGGFNFTIHHVINELLHIALLLSKCNSLKFGPAMSWVSLPMSPYGKRFACGPQLTFLSHPPLEGFPRCLGARRIGSNPLDVLWISSNLHRLQPWSLNS